MHLSMRRKSKTLKTQIVTLVPEDESGNIDKIDILTLKIITDVLQKSPSKMLPSKMRK